MSKQYPSIIAANSLAFHVLGLHKMSKTGAKRKHDYQAVYQFIISYKTEFCGESPSLREIMRAMDISSTSTTRNILIRLAKEGKIVYDGPNCHIHVTGATWTPPREL